MYKIAIDVGGTNTDAVITNEDNKLIAKTKVNTSLDIVSGITKAMQEVTAISGIDLSQVKWAMLGTTQCTNAIVERKKLEKVEVIRLAGQSGHAIEPFCDWPQDLVETINGGYHIVDGGYDYDGSEIAAINYQQIDDIISNNTTHNYAICGVYSPLNNEQEQAVADYIASKDANANISISSQIGSLNLLERENATILNSSLRTVINTVVSGFKDGLIAVGITNAKAYICQNDGTIMNASYALSYPILTISSGPTNSIRGGAKLAVAKDAIIVDIGGTTTDVGAVVKGLARESQGKTAIGGVESNFRMPDMISIGVGGGTIVTIENDNIKIGPESVGYQLTQKALCFGGDTLTLSDVAKRLGRIEIGDTNVDDKLSLQLATEIDRKTNEMILVAIEAMKTEAVRTQVILVGGGSIVANPKYFTEDDIIIPENYGVANALGASIAQTSGSYESLIAMIDKDRESEVAKVVDLAIENAITTGADRQTIEVVSISQTPLSYHPQEAYVVKAKVIGDLAHSE